MEFIISNYVLFIVLGIVLLLGLFGYMVDKKKYKKYREEIIQEGRVIDSLENEPNVESIATPVSVDDTADIPESNPEQ